MKLFGDVANESDGVNEGSTVDDVELVGSNGNGKVDDGDSVVVNDGSVVGDVELDVGVNGGDAELMLSGWLFLNGNIASMKSSSTNFMLPSS